MKYIGLLCNCSPDGSPKDELSPSLVNRAFLLDRLLAPEGMRIFVFSPRDVTAAPEVPGFTVLGDELVPASRPVPRVNANWTYGTRRLLKEAMGYRHFQRWLDEHGISVYVPYAFAELVSNKRKAYEAVRGYDPALHPHTEDYSGSLVQVETFVRRGTSVFIKPRSGNRGNKIFVIRPGAGGYALKYYEDGGQRLFEPLTLESAIGVIAAVAGGKSYVIQAGVESLRVDGAVFDVRVVMVNDGHQWHSILETRLAPPGSDLSNIFQGGTIRVTETLLSETLGDVAAQALQEKIQRVAHGLAGHLESFFPGALMELGFDFVIDHEQCLHLVEINSKPGVAGLGSETRIFEWTDEDWRHYERWVRPHVTHLAGFLRTKVEQAALSET